MADDKIIRPRSGWYGKTVYGFKQGDITDFYWNLWVSDFVGPRNALSKAERAAIKNHSCVAFRAFIKRQKDNLIKNRKISEKVGRNIGGR